MRYLPGILRLVCLGAMMALPPVGAHAADIKIAPPPLPVYRHPSIPGPNYIWSPGYWAYADNGYFWVPGTWVKPPDTGLLWTPGYWSSGNDAYEWHEGYWAPHVGFYGGINYGFGYTGYGYEGGRWDGKDFRYNTAVYRLNKIYFRKTYAKAVGLNADAKRVSFNGGDGGTSAKPHDTELQADSDKHLPPTDVQTGHAAAAKDKPSFYFSVNRGRPVIGATSKPGSFSGTAVVLTRGSKITR